MLSRFYDHWLYWAEVLAIYALVAIVTTLGLFNIIYMNFINAGWDLAWISSASYGLTYYLCLMGAIVASRKADHITIDVIGHFLSPSARAKVGGAALLAASVASFALSLIAVQYVDTIIRPGEDAAHLLPWRWPLIPFFAVIGLHLLIQSYRKFTGTFHQPEELATEGGN